MAIEFPNASTPSNSPIRPRTRPFAQPTFHSPRPRVGDVSLYVPPPVRYARSTPLVILLHGVYGSHWAWFTKGAAHHRAAPIGDGSIRPMLIAAPSDGCAVMAPISPLPGRRL
jgi:hypothetical protein